MSANRTNQRRGVVLTELMVMFLISVLLLAALGQAVTNLIYMEQVVVEGAARTDACESLCRRLERDAAGIAGYGWDGQVLTLQPAFGDEQVRYEIRADRAVRFVDGVERDLWAARRLDFGPRLEPGAHADVLWIEFHETPPRRARHLPHRTWRHGLLLPRAADRAVVAEES